MLMTGCDSFLDIQPVGKVIPTTAPEFRSLITEAYVTVPDDRGLASFRSDEIRLDGTTSSNDLSSYLDIWRWKDDTPDENTATFSWRQFYHVLFIANYVIECEKLMTDGSSAEIKQMVGEAYMLRAYMHFLLANLHAPAYTACDPAVTKAVPLKLNSDVDGILSRNTLAEVYESIYYRRPHIGRVISQRRLLGDRLQLPFHYSIGRRSAFARNALHGPLERSARSRRTRSGC